MKRTLNLKREALSELTDDQLVEVAGAAEAVTGGRTCPALGCKLSLLHAWCPSAFTCPTEQ